MARQPRFQLPGHPQHIIQRGNNRQIIFASEDDYAFYLESLAEACNTFECELHAYVLMSNHVHLLITPWSDDGISRVMQSLGRKYVQYFNYRYGRTGTLWEGRYKATLLDSEQYLLTGYRYIELNPVRAGMVNSPSNYTWSSHKHNAHGKQDPLITAHPLYTALGKAAEDQQKAYQDLFKSYFARTGVFKIRALYIASSLLFG